MQFALVINIRIARRELVITQREGLAGLLRAGRRYPLVIGHDGLADGLAVDRPGRAMVMRLAFLGAVIDMAEDAEAELRVLVKDFPLRPVLGQVLADEFGIGASLLDERADLLSALTAR